MNKETKRDTYNERDIILKKINSIKKSIEGLERRIDKIDATSFDIKTKTFKKEAVDKMNVLENKILNKEKEIELLNKEYDRLLKLQTKVDIIL